MPGQAKKLLAHVLRASGHLVAGKSMITVRPARAANTSERDTIAALLSHCNRPKLLLPGDLEQRAAPVSSPNA